MREASEFMRERKSFVEEHVEEYSKKMLSIFNEALEKAWNDKTEFFKAGKVRMVDESQKIQEVTNEIREIFGGNEKEAEELCDEIIDRANVIVLNELELLGWKCETDAEAQKIHNLDYLPYCLVPIEETSAK